MLGVFEAKATIPASLGSAATEQEKGRLFREVVGIKKLHLGRVVGRENKTSSDHQPLGSTSSFLFRVAMFLREARSRRSLSL